MRIAIASVRWLPDEFQDDRRLADALRARGAEATSVAWDDPAVEWTSFDLVVVRSTWDYAERRDEFCAWADAVGERLHNVPALIRWNTDKRYLGDLASAGYAVVETAYVDPGSAVPELGAEVVVKPTVSAGARDTGRFGPARHDAARALVAAIGASGRTAMIQPYMESVDSLGETAIVFIDGRPSHALRKRAVLAGEGIAPTRDDALGAAEAMYDPDLVGAGSAEQDELALAMAIVDEIAHRYSGPPLYARVDLVRGPDSTPRLLELETVEPNLYLDQSEGAAERFAEAVVARVRAGAAS